MYYKTHKRLYTNFDSVYVPQVFESKQKKQKRKRKKKKKKKARDTETGTTDNKKMRKKNKEFEKRNYSKGKLEEMTNYDT